MKVLIAQAELERIPRELETHQTVRKHAKALGKKPNQLLLDQNHHAQACRALEDGERRGRPDITHYTLLGLLESPLNKDGNLEVAIHTRNDELIRVRSDTRLPRGEARFQGLMTKVLAEGNSGQREPLLWLERCSPEDALARFASGHVLRLDEGGEVLDRDGLRAKGAVTLVLGGFPSGDWSPAWKAAAPDTVSIYHEPLNAWAVAAEVAAWAR